jgi:ATP-dependent Clp protease ATP-binding subunit ClpB
MGRIVEIQLERLERLLTDRKITLDLDDSAVQWLADKGYDPAYGARPLKRVMQKELQDPLAEKILGGEIKDGSTVIIAAGSDRLIFRTKAAPADKDAEMVEAEKAA